MVPGDRQRRAGHALTHETVPAAASTGRVARAYRALQRWADAGWANSAVFAWGLLQGTIVPGLADVFFLPLALAKPSRAYTLALSATAGTVTGSVLLYVLATRVLSTLSGTFAGWLGVSAAGMEHTRVLLEHYGWLVILASTVSPISTKLTSVASGAFGVPWAGFVGALTAGRLLRTGAEAWLVRNGGANALARWVNR